MLGPVLGTDPKQMLGYSPLYWISWFRPILFSALKVWKELAAIL